MSGQAGSARALLNYNTEMNTLVGGFKVKPSDRLKIAVDIAQNSAEAEIDPWRMPEAEAWAAPKPNQTFDFSQSHLNSDLDTTYLEAGIKASFKAKEGMYVTGSYRYLDFEDDAPYLGDDSGRLEYLGLGIAWKF